MSIKPEFRIWKNSVIPSPPLRQDGITEFFQITEWRFWQRLGRASGTAAYFVTGAGPTGQSSVRKGEAGSPAALMRLHSGLSAHA